MEFISPTKVVVLRSLFSKDTIENFWNNDFLSFIQDLQVKKIIVSHYLWKNIIPFQDQVDYRFLYHGDGSSVEKNWTNYLEQCNWKEELNELPIELVNTKLNWKHTISSSVVQIATFCKLFNFT
jgi:transposase-like protein